MIVNHFVQVFKRKHKNNITGKPRALIRLRTACERAKRTPSCTTQTTIELDSLFEGVNNQGQIRGVEHGSITEDPVEKCLQDAKMDKNSIHEWFWWAAPLGSPRCSSSRRTLSTAGSPARASTPTRPWPSALPPRQPSSVVRATRRFPPDHIALSLSLPPPSPLQASAATIFCRYLKHPVYSTFLNEPNSTRWGNGFPPLGIEDIWLDPSK